MKCKVVLFSSYRITLVCPGLTSVTFPYFAVIAFILQKVQQGIAIPKRIPSPLKAILPPAPTRSMWDLNEKKVDELTNRLKEDGYKVVSGPRTTGDGYYESCVVALEGNQIEITV